MHEKLRRALLRLEMATKVKPVIKVSHMLAVTVEHQRWLFRCKQSRADAPFSSLAPARMIDFRVDVCIEAILVRCHQFPTRFRLFFDKAHLDDALDALEAVFPWDDQPDRLAVLVRSDFPVFEVMIQRAYRYAGSDQNIVNTCVVVTAFEDQP